MQTVKLPGAGLDLAADLYGDESDPPVLLLHGGGQTRHAWGSAAARLAEAGNFAVSIDLRGHGQCRGGDSALDARATARRGR